MCQLPANQRSDLVITCINKKFTTLSLILFTHNLSPLGHRCYISFPMICSGAQAEYILAFIRPCLLPFFSFALDLS